MAHEGQKADVWADDEGIGGYSHDDGGNAVEDIGSETDGVGQFGAAPELREIDASADADGDADDAGQAEQDRRPDNGIGHAAAHFAGGLGNLGKEVEVERTRALVEKVDEEGHQGRSHK